MMAQKEHKQPLVIPKWLSFGALKNDRELLIPANKVFVINDETKKQLNSSYDQFKRNPNITLASELLSTAIILKQLDFAREAAEYISRGKGINSLLQETARNVLFGANEESVELDYRQKLKNTRLELSEYPNSPISWVELARVQTVLGLKEKARKSIVIALSLAPHDRFIARSAFRFFIHIGDFESAYHYIRIAAAYGNDPWIRATEINAALLRGDKANKLKKPRVSTVAPKDAFHYSELVESAALLELLAGDEKKAKKTFRQAWHDPSRNVVTHAEWVLRNVFPSMQKSEQIDLSISAEALTWRTYYEGRFDQALIYASDWILQEPYSSFPFLSASHIACYWGKASQAVEFAAEGLIANPNDAMLRNNKAFAYLLLNKVDLAEPILNSIHGSIPERQKACLLATSGLLNFKKGRLEEGRSLYIKSIELCKRINDLNLATKASLHLALAELEAKSPEAETFARQALAMSQNSSPPDILTLREQINSNLAKRRALKK